MTPSPRTPRPTGPSAAVLTVLLAVAAGTTGALASTDLSAFAGAAAPEFDEVPDYVDVRTFLDKDAYHAGTTVRLAIEMRIDPRVHVNASVPTFDYLIPTSITWQEIPAGIELGPIQWPRAHHQAFEFTDGVEIAVYEGVKHALVEARIAAGTTPGAHRLSGRLRAQGCTETACFAPQTDPVRATIRVVPSDEDPQPINEAVFTAAVAGLSKDPPASSPRSAAPAPRLAAAKVAADSDLDCPIAAAGSLGGGHSLWLIYVLSFLGGLALTLTPCVLPLVPITIGYFSRQQASGGRPVAMAATYVLGLALTYSVLGTVAALSGSLFGSVLQNPWVLASIGTVLVALALSMFGILPDLTLPTALQGRIGGARSGPLGALAMGAAMGLIAAPCVGPFVVSLLTYVASLAALMPAVQAAAVGGSLFFVLALGLGVPFFLVGMGVASIRPGAWMVAVKQVFGFLVLGVALWIVRPILGTATYEAGLVVVAAAAAVFLLVRARGGGRWRFALTAGGTVLLVVATVATLDLAGFVDLRDRERQAALRHFEEYSEERLAAARRDGRPVVIDFTADWCAVCKEIERRVFPDGEVQELFADFVLLVADLTDDSDPSVQELYRSYGIRGLPCIVFLDSQGEEIESLRLTGFEPPAEFANRLRCATSFDLARAP